MRKLLLFVMMACMSTACEKSPEQRARELVTEGITKGADDPSSVQDVELLFLKKQQHVDAHGNKYWEHIVHVRYREKNVYGALVKKEGYVVFNEDFTKIESWDALGR